MTAYRDPDRPEIIWYTWNSLRETIYEAAARADALRNSTAPNRGRPRQYASNADRQRAYRERKRRERASGS